MDRERIEGFVRDALGCTCPDEVFARIEDDSLPATSTKPPIRRIAIGGRLLVYLVDIGEESSDGPELEACVREGIKDRDRLGMNRFRLVLAVDRPDRIAAAASARFERVPGLDDKAHLHLIARRAIP